MIIDMTHRVCVANVAKEERPWKDAGNFKSADPHTSNIGAPVVRPASGQLHNRISLFPVSERVLGGT